MLVRDQQMQGYDGLIQFPSDTQNAARSLNVDMQATDAAAAGAAGTSAKANWDSFLAAWMVYFKPIDDSWAYNPLGAAAFADQATIEDWRKRMKLQQAALVSAGSDSGAMPASPAVVPDSPLSPLTDALGQAKWVIIGGVALIILLKYLPSKKG